MRRFNLGPVGEADCPVFDGMMEYFQVRSAVCHFACFSNGYSCAAALFDGVVEYFQVRLRLVLFVDQAGPFVDQAAATIDAGCWWRKALP